MNVYAVLGAKIPDDLHLPIKKKRVKAPVTPPVDFITPQLDGRVTNYFEWQSAGLYHTEAGATGTMHKSENFIQTIYFGFNNDNLFFRIDTTKPITLESVRGVRIKLLLHKPESHEITARFCSRRISSSSP